MWNDSKYHARARNTLLLYLSLFLYLPVFPFFTFYCVCKLTFLCLSQLLHWMLLCSSILHVVCLISFVFIHFHSALSSIFQREWEALSCSCSLMIYTLPLLLCCLLLFSVTHAGLCSLSNQDTLEATDVSFSVHNKPFQLFHFLFVSAAAVTSNPLQAERSKPTVCVLSE